ncbi:hypothetical protein NG799_04410 [Laspinema sp. D1]|uniref:Uncharacterized protein n=1 Tax=Laspinema palackyanum D2a TaxID=2953684 RepID=A0ABT2MLE8_9CYAN|nr:hypothetical protein [Laspinema sp. D2a]
MTIFYPVQNRTLFPPVRSPWVQRSGADFGVRSPSPPITPIPHPSCGFYGGTPTLSFLWEFSKEGCTGFPFYDRNFHLFLVSGSRIHKQTGTLF